MIDYLAISVAITMCI